MTRLFDRISWVWVLIGWTIFLWLSRLRNVLNDDDLTSSGRAVRVGVVVVFVALAAVSALAVRRQWPGVIAGFLVWTVCYWLIRGVGILVDGEYSATFKAIHTALMLVSLALAALAGRQLQSQRL